jgi:hypothetical protein
MKNLQKFNEFIKEQIPLNEGFVDVKIAIQDNIKTFLNDIVIAKSKGYVKNEKDAAMLLFDILEDMYKIPNKNR